jgi:hypothetical protein
MRVFLLLLLISSILAAPTFAADDVRILPLPTNEIVYDSHSGLIYATVPSNAGGGVADTVTAIDPLSGSIVYSLFVGGGPNKMALSRDGKYLYVGLDGARMVRQIDLGARSLGLTFALGTPAAPRVALDIEVDPNNRDIVAVALGRTMGVPVSDAIAIFDHGSQRYRVASDVSNLIDYSDSSSTLYGLDTETTGVELRKLYVDESGIALPDIESKFAEGLSFQLEYEAGRLYSSGGSIVNAATLITLGRFADIRGLVRPDFEHNRAYFVRTGVRGSISSTSVDLLSYNLTTFACWGNPGSRASQAPASRPWCVGVATDWRFERQEDKYSWLERVSSRGHCWIRRHCRSSIPSRHLLSPLDRARRKSWLLETVSSPIPSSVSMAGMLRRRMEAAAASPLRFPREVLRSREICPSLFSTLGALETRASLRLSL